jgi:hypothetical protein
MPATSATTEILPPDYGTTYLPMNAKNGTTMYISGPSVSSSTTTSSIGPITHQLPNGYATTNGYSTTTSSTNIVPEFTNLTPMMSSVVIPPTNSQYTAQQILSNTSFNLNDHSNPSSASSSRTKLQNIGCDDSGISSHNGSLLMSQPPQMNGFGSPQMEIKLEDDLDPMPRDRCNTWPLRRPTLDINAQTSPLIHDRIPEEETIYDSSEHLSGSGMLGPGDLPSNNSFSDNFVQLGSPDDLSQDGGNESPNSSAKKATTRRNAWGNMSYADLITQAILNSPEKRLTLSQVYEWMVQNVPYFRDKGDSNSSAGWKNSIRHNLSLHSRFMRIQNEGAGKSSWWVINPDAKPGRNPRRRAQTMESTTKAKLERSRRGARKRIEMGALRSGGSSMVGSTASIVSHEIFNDMDDALNSNFDTFRGRTHSNVSAIGARLPSPVDRFDEFDFPPWGVEPQQRSSNPEVNEIMGRTGEMRLENNSDFKTDFRGIPTTDSNTLLGDFPGPKLEFEDPPPPYQDLNPIRAPMPTMQQQPMMRSNFAPSRPQQNIPQSMRMTNQPNGYYTTGPPVYNNQGMMLPPQGHPQQQQQQWQPNGMDGYIPNNSTMHSMHHSSNQQYGGQNNISNVNNGQLPMDLENLTLPDSMEFASDVETILRHELSQTHNQQINFDL